MATIWSKASWCMNDWGDPVSRRVRQRNGDVAEAPLVSDGKVVNVTSFMVTTPLIKSGSCSGVKALSVCEPYVKSTSGAWSSGTESMRAERMAL